MGFTSTTKSKKYRGRSGTNKGSLSFTAGSVVKRKALDAVQHAARGQRKFLGSFAHLAAYPFA
jgi:hypothetical protein